MSKDILETIDWALDTSRDKLMFGMDSKSAALSRENRLFGVLLECKEFIKYRENTSEKRLGRLENIIEQLYAKESSTTMRSDCWLQAYEYLKEYKGYE